MMGVEGVLEAAGQANDIDAELKMNPDIAGPRRDHLQTRFTDQCQRRDGGFDFLIEASEQASRLTKELEPLAKVDFTKLVAATRSA
jgi:hypothetical protein